MSDPTSTPGAVPSSSASSATPSQPQNTTFEKQRDLLLQEITTSLDSVVYNLEVLNRSLNMSVQVGKEFDNIGRLWNSFYDGVGELQRRNQQPSHNESDDDGH